MQAVKLCSIQLLIVLLAGCGRQKQSIYSIPLMAGEVTQTSAIFQSRLSEKDTLIYENIHDAASIERTDLPGATGTGFFEISKTAGFETPMRTRSMKTDEINDYIIKIKTDSLEPGTKYYYRLRYGKENDTQYISKVQSFSTLPPADMPAKVGFVMMACYNLDGFYLGAGFGEPTTEGADAYRAEDKYQGFPGFRTVAGMKPDFFINNGDNVYYDLPPGREAKTIPQMRAKWHRQTGMYTMRQLFSVAPSYSMKDDHDDRYDDADTVLENKRHGTMPTHSMGMKTFLEQAPVVDLATKDTITRTYRTHKIGSLLQIWIVEGRDYRSPNKSEDGAAKSLWGAEQKQWLKQTLLESKATFKLLISPTPMIGPDDARKTDNHTNFNGFRYERDEFFTWLKENKFTDKNFYILCGDRHWQYHSIDPSGIEEFSSGTITDQNARLGRKPGDPKSTDTAATIVQPHLQSVASGGFMKVDITPSPDKTSAEMQVTFYDENGKELYRVKKLASDSPPAKEGGLKNDAKHVF